MWLASILGRKKEKKKDYIVFVWESWEWQSIIYLFFDPQIFLILRNISIVWFSRKRKKKINNNNNLQKIQFSSVDVNQKNHFWKRVYFIRWRVWRLVSGAQLQNNHDNIQTNPKLIHNQYFYDCFHIHIQFNTSLTPHTKLKFQNLRDNLEIIYKIFIPSCKLFMKFHLKN